MNARSNCGKTAFMWACTNGHKDVVQLLLSYSDRNFELNGRIRGLTAFNWACYKGHYDVIQLLKQNSEAKNIYVDYY